MKKILFLLALCLITMATAACAGDVAEPPVAENVDNSTQPAVAEEVAITDNVAADQAEDPFLSVPESDMVVIGDKMFIARCDDIRINPDDYMDKTIKLEGIYSEFTDSASGETYHYVNRKGPGCCGSDGIIGFEFLYDGDTDPQDNDWVEAVGKLDYVDDGNYKFLVLRLSKLTVLDERGMEFVVD